MAGSVAPGFWHVESRPGLRRLIAVMLAGAHVQEKPGFQQNPAETGWSRPGVGVSGGVGFKGDITSCRKQQGRWTR
jgi:hypothetical protein